MYGGDFAEKIWWAFIDAGYSPYATAGAMGNFACESGIISYRVQGDYVSPYEASKAYTEQVDSGAVSRDQFINGGPRRRTDMDYVSGRFQQEKQDCMILLKVKE